MHPTSYSQLQLPSAPPPAYAEGGEDETVEKQKVEISGLRRRVQTLETDNSKLLERVFKVEDQRNALQEENKELQKKLRKAKKMDNVANRENSSSCCCLAAIICCLYCFSRSAR